VAYICDFFGCQSQTRSRSYQSSFFFIFAIKFSHFITYENNVIATKWPSLMAKNGKKVRLRRRKFARIYSRCEFKQLFCDSLDIFLEKVLFISLSFPLLLEHSRGILAKRGSLNFKTFENFYFIFFPAKEELKAN
jgi:hypothetical protein